MSVRGAAVDVTDMLRPERAALLDLLRGCSVKDWDRPTECPAWSVKGVALHVLGDDLSLLARQRDAAPSGLIGFAVDHPGSSFRDLLDGFNEQWVTASSFLSTELLLTLLQLVGDWSDTFYNEVGLETVSGEPVGIFAETEPSPYWQVIAREYVERLTHQSQIRRALGAPALQGEIVTEAARVVTHLLAAWLGDYDVPAGAAIAIEWGDAGALTLARDANGWVVRAGSDDASAAVRFADDAVVPAISRGISAADLASSITITGDDALARGALAVVAPLLARPQP